MFGEFWQAHRDLANKNKDTISTDMYVHILKNVNGNMNYINFHLEDVNNEQDALGFYQALIDAEKQLKGLQKNILGCLYSTLFLCFKWLLLIKFVMLNSFKFNGIKVFV